MVMHADEVTVSADTVRRLVATQLPRWAGLPVVALRTSGTVNAVFRLGTDLAVRVPRRARDPDVVRADLEREAAAAREVHGRVPVPTPEPLAIGEPGDGCPVPWAVQTWLDGTDATVADPGASDAFAQDLAAFVRAVRALGTHGRTFTGTNRGGDLRRHDTWVDECLHRSEGLLDVPTLRRTWAEARELPRTAPDAMTHGDLVPGNVLVADGRLAGVLDVGGVGPADPALDLVGAWHLLDTGPRAVLRAALDVDDLEWARGRAWALEQALGLVWYYERSAPVLSRVGRRTIDRLLRDP